ncbi:uncharacterized protein PHALS_05249 [Plasmopara halstedii]|uniref:Uncharacterized protein n=1 Tax=Plasmopara halstedii TaxID=4781 RepID=A0A0P1B337_PLAHL|nr:uncharacterized protein PHALS_05249 [Plasmopara halstedii]CEG47926.1 hypothetical protein PHALS_05249 [Plasmopara halstedii]|eukprot:XP_024584295.1 hypothetical protein PHALS_05249 [Plasmopara halstedii]
MQLIHARFLQRTRAFSRRSLIAPFQSLPYSPINVHPSRRNFSFIAMYATPNEAAIDDTNNIDKAKSRLVCGKCNAMLSNTEDLVFFKWKNGTHISSASGEPLKNLLPVTSPDDRKSSWKKHKMLCINCNFQVGTLAQIFTSDKVLFSASCVAIQLPDDQSPLLSLSGYPTAFLSFSMWSELMLMVETQPKLKNLLQIRRLDNIYLCNTESIELNRKLRMAGDLQELLRIVDENITALNHVNIRTAIYCTDRFTSTRSAQANFLTISTNVKVSKSEASQDDLLSLSSQASFPKLSAMPDALDTKRFRKLIDETDKLVNFGIAAFNKGSALSYFASALKKLGVGRLSILQPMALQVMHMLQLEKPVINSLEACIVVSVIAYMLPRESRHQEWVGDFLQAVSQMVLSELDDDKTSDETKLQAAQNLVPLAQSFLFLERFDSDLFRRTFTEMNAGALDKLGISSNRAK